MLACSVALPAEFVASMVKRKLPAAVGVPLITPPALKERPAGSVLLTTDHVMGVDPELARVVKYGIPSVPGASGEVLVMEGGVAVAPEPVEGGGVEAVPIALFTAAKSGCVGF